MGIYPSLEYEVPSLEIEVPTFKNAIQCQYDLQETLAYS